jgi:hypothetical protein
MKGGDAFINSFFERLKNLIKKEQLIQTAKKEIKAGETWIYLLQLKKGIKYSISTSGSVQLSTSRPLF